MSHSTIDRVAASGGAAFAVFAVCTLVIAPPAPAVDATAGEVRGYLTDHHDRFALSVAVMVLAVVALVLALGHVHRRIAATDRDSALPGAFLVAGAVTAAMALAGALLQAVLVRLDAGATDDATLVALYQSWQVVAFMGPPIPMTVVLVLAAERTLRDSVLPRWTAWVALASAAGGLVTALVNLGSDLRVPLVLDAGSFLLACVWLTAVSVAGFTTRRPAPAAALR